MNLTRKLKICLLRTFVRTVGKMSDGIRIAFDAGFTSGIMLDYIYRNRPGGRLLLGRLIDRWYLRHPGWEVIRVRERNLQLALTKAIAVQRPLDRSPVVLDIASGPARYVLDILAEEGMSDVVAVCRDQDETPLNLGRHNAEERGLSDVRFELGDALSAESLAAVRPRPNIVVSSGFYDWITEDELVKKSMSLVHDMLPDGGCFVFTNQSGHVDLEMTQGIFVDFRGEPLRMKIRPTAEVNSWAESAGFRVLETVSDDAGHYSVTLAQKPLASPGD